MAEPQELTVCIAVYQHKHGEELSVFRTLEGAKSHLREIAKEFYEGWSHDAPHIGDTEAWDKIVENWHVMAGWTEFMRIEARTLQD